MGALRKLMENNTTGNAKKQTVNDKISAAELVPAYEVFLENEKKTLNNAFAREAVKLCYNHGNVPKKKIVEAFRASEEYQNRIEELQRESSEYQTLMHPESEAAIRKYEQYKAQKIEENRIKIMLDDARKQILDFFETHDGHQLVAQYEDDIVSRVVDEIKKCFAENRQYIYMSAEDTGRFDFIEEIDVTPENIETYLVETLEADGYLLSDYITDWTDLSDPIPYMINILAEIIPELSAIRENIGNDLWKKVLQGKEIKKTAFHGSLDTDDLVEKVRMHFDEAMILECLSQNPDYIREKAAFEARKLEKLRLEANILNRVPDRYTDLFPGTRKMKRKFVIHIGPTNSGKTYDAMQMLRKSESGVYLAPLRLLAYEQFESLNSSGYPCSLWTGEERIDVPEARFTASTVEMADFSKTYETAVIDEAQMLGDPDRGGAWTAAILGIKANNVHVCAAPIAEQLIIRLVEECGDEYEVVTHERHTPLIMEEKAEAFPKGIQRGDACIVFSRANVHAVAAELQKKGHKVSVIYGALPYDVRHEEARKFAAGETDVVVATDAIGMGLNMPIRRVVFLEASKYDGITRRILTPEETKQVAGRAGRYGLYNEGFVTGVRETYSTVKKAVTAESSTVSKAMISFQEQLIGIEGSLSSILKKWNEMPAVQGYEKADCTREIVLSEKLEEYGEADKRTIYSFITIPFDEKNERLKTAWRSLYRTYKAGRDFVISEYRVYKISEKAEYNAKDMPYLEEDSKVCDLLYFFAERFGYGEQAKQIMQIKQSISKAIMQILTTQKLRGRSCKYCGKILPWNYPYGMCQKCHDRQYNYGYTYAYW